MPPKDASDKCKLSDNTNTQRELRRRQKLTDSNPERALYYNTKRTSDRITLGHKYKVKDSRQYLAAIANEKGDEINAWKTRRATSLFATSKYDSLQNTCISADDHRFKKERYWTQKMHDQFEDNPQPMENFLIDLESSKACSRGRQAQKIGRN